MILNGRISPESPRARAPRMAALRVISALALSAASFAAAAEPASYVKEIKPILTRSCEGCHNPAKLEGKLDLSTYDALMQGGKFGPAIEVGKPGESFFMDMIGGESPPMPKDRPPLKKDEVELIARWIAEGAKDDTKEQRDPFDLESPPVYIAPPVITAMAFSPDGATLAISGYHEVFLAKPDGSGIAARLQGRSPRIETIRFSPDGKRIAISGGAPSQFGEIQLWDAESRKQIKSHKLGHDTVFGLSFSPDGEKLAYGGADKTARMVSAEDGSELLKFENHSDWVLATLFTRDGKRILSGSRDMAMKIINVANGQFIDDINNPLEQVLCMARHPSEDVAVYGGDLGTARAYRISENTGRTAARNDTNLVKEFERLAAPIRAIAFNPDGKSIAVGTAAGEGAIYSYPEGKRVAALKGSEGAIFAIAYNPKAPEVATGGFDGKVRVFSSDKGEPLREFYAIPALTHEKMLEALKQVASGPIIRAKPMSDEEFLKSLRE